MIDPQKLDELVRKLSDAIPEGMKGFDQEAKRQFRSILESGIEKLNLVSREEFDIQVKVLARTRVKVDELEAQLANIEQSLTEQSSKTTED